MTRSLVSMLLLKVIFAAMLFVLFSLGVGNRLPFPNCHGTCLEFPDCAVHCKTIGYEIDGKCLPSSKGWCCCY
ncbi:hypothetical protein AAZX31_20G068600 [Glycine max]|uniref:Uncharacterized protein n=1 Tax=Glycine soja TaxID=3848 RepID=A0A445F280_GLYSO|nr:hypothetical protein D0Y65_053450 [Glycine soja]